MTMTKAASNREYGLSNRVRTFLIHLLPWQSSLNHFTQRGWRIAELHACCRASSACLVKLTFPRDAFVQFP
jgi:hypothetical protein